MMNKQQLNIFKFADANNESLRVIIDEETNEILFNAKDICDILKYSNARKAILDHVDSEDVTKRYTLISEQNGTGRTQKQLMQYVNESGLYALILGSKKPEAKIFKRWVTSEVLPSIRKTGAYHSENKTPSQPQFVIDPNLEIQLKIAELELQKSELEVRTCAERLADRIISNFPNLSESSKQQLLAHAYSTVTQSEHRYLLPLVTKKTFTATELAEKYGKSPQAFGRILNQLNLKTSEFSECRVSKSKYNDKQVDQYFYFESVLSILDQYFQK